MHTSSVDSPPRPEHRTTAGIAGVLALCSALLLTLVAARWSPLISADGDIADTTHRWAVDEPALTRACRILTDWVWDPWTMRLLCAAVVVWLVVRWRRGLTLMPMAATVTVVVAAVAWTVVRNWPGFPLVPTVLTG